jgi:hypothetical protein
MSGQLHALATLPSVSIGYEAGGSQSQFGQYGVGKILDPTGTQIQNLQFSDHSQLLYWLLFNL